MDQKQLEDKLNVLIAQWENEVVEFKEASNDYDTDKIGRYFSALANEANLRGLGEAWLVFGVRDSDRQVVGTNYREEPERLQSLKQQVAADTEPGLHFKDVHICNHPEGRVVMMHIPAAPNGIPIAWKGHYYARAGASITPLDLNKQDEFAPRPQRPTGRRKLCLRPRLTIWTKPPCKRRGRLSRSNMPTAFPRLRS